MIDRERVERDYRFRWLVETEYARWKRMGRPAEMHGIADRLLIYLDQSCRGIGIATDVKPTRRPFGVQFTVGDTRWALRLNSHNMTLSVLK